MKCFHRLWVRFTLQKKKRERERIEERNCPVSSMITLVRQLESWRSWRWCQYKRSSVLPMIFIVDEEANSERRKTNKGWQWNGEEHSLFFHSVRDYSKSRFRWLTCILDWELGFGRHKMTCTISYCLGEFKDRTFGTFSIDTVKHKASFADV